jgi:methylase of polypeptide subunit release factors
VPSAQTEPTWTPASLRIESWRFVEDFDKGVAVFATVFWDRSDTVSLREWIRGRSLVRGKSVLDIGTGSGLLALCCLQAGAEHAVATDVNRAAVANARYNGDHLGLAERLDVRQVPLENSSAFAVIQPDEQFDFIVSNPPWVNRRPTTIEEYALYDADFALLTSLFHGLHQHLKPGGSVLLAYGCVDAVRTVQRLAKQYQYELIIRDERNLDELPEEFLPGMLLEIRLPSAALTRLSGRRPIRSPGKSTSGVARALCPS